MPRARLESRRSPVAAQVDLGGVYRLTEIEHPGLAGALPGQFVMVRTPGLDPLLGRPFSVFSLPSPGRFGLVYNVVGRGTERMAAARPGETLLVLGPLGVGFERPRPGSRALLVAGGIGIAGLHLQAEVLVGAGVPTRLLYGARTAADLVTAERFAALGLEVEVATDDGSRGRKGFVTALLEEALDDARREGGPPPAVYACGPSPMLRRVRELTVPRAVPCQLALEARMACGFGVCIGCAVPSAKEPGTYRLVCTDGPCIDAAEVLP